jgi:radical SAM superfamily enzyme YgiQ (UPF0313 family)
MNAQDWCRYFEQNSRDRRGIPWHESARIPAGERLLLAWVARHLENVEARVDAGASAWWRGAVTGRRLEKAVRTEGWAEAMRLCAAERREDARIVWRLLEGEAPAEPIPTPRLAGRLALQFKLPGDFVALKVAEKLLRKTSSGAMEAVCRQLIHDLRFQVRCLTDYWRRKRTRWYYWPKAMREAPIFGMAGTMQPRLALLINPFYRKDPHASFGKHVLTPSLALSSLAAATPPDWTVRVWDENLLQGPPPVDPLPEVVGITVHLTFARRAFELANWYRQHGCKVVLGGPHVTACPDECAAHADALAAGEGTRVWPVILRDVAAGLLEPVYRGDYRQEFSEEPVPRRALVPRWGFLTGASVIATRGCRNRCGFCYLSTDGLQMPYQTRPVGEVAAEIKATEEPYAVFLDNNLGARPEYLRQLCRALSPLEMIWSAAVTLDVTDDPSLVREMGRAGCTGVFVGFESLAPENLAAARKRTPLPEDYGRRVGIFHDNGIQVNGSFVLGFDHDRRDCFERTVEWIEQYRLECATFHILTPYPGTPQFQQLETEGRLLHKNWDLYDTAHAVFRPRHMSPEELEAGYALCYERLFSDRSIWVRRPAEARAVLPYLAMSYLYKRSNLFWHLLIRHRLTHALWRPLVEHSRRRHVQFRKTLEEQEPARSFSVVPASV